VIALLLPNVVGRALPFQFTTELDVKFAPNTFSAKAGPLCTPVDGEIAQTNGTPEAEMANDTLGEKTNPPPPFGVYTATLLHPAVTMFDLSIDAVNWLPLTNVVGQTGAPLNAIIVPRSCGFGVGLLGVQGGAACGCGAMKFEPFTVRVNVAPPGVAVAGLMLVIKGVAGTTGSIRNVAEFWLNPPPGAGFDAVICACPGDATSVAKTVSAI